MNTRWQWIVLVACVAPIGVELHAQEFVPANTGQLAENNELLNRPPRGMRLTILFSGSEIAKNTPLGKAVDGGVGANIGLGIPFGPGRPTPRGGWLQFYGVGGFDYTYWDGNNDVQLNGPKTNSVLDHMNVYAGQFGGELRCLRPVGERGLIWVTSLGVVGRLGCAHADLQPFAFDPNTAIITLREEPKDRSFLGGYRVNLGAGVVLRNGAVLKGYVGYGQDFTDALAKNSRLNTVSTGVNLEVLVPLRATMGSGSRFTYSLVDAFR